MDPDLPALIPFPPDGQPFDVQWLDLEIGGLKVRDGATYEIDPDLGALLIRFPSAPQSMMIVGFEEIAEHMHHAETSFTMRAAEQFGKELKATRPGVKVEIFDQAVGDYVAVGLLAVLGQWRCLACFRTSPFGTKLVAMHWNGIAENGVYNDVSLATTSFRFAGEPTE